LHNEQAGLLAPAKTATAQVAQFVPHVVHVAPSAVPK